MHRLLETVGFVAIAIAIAIVVGVGAQYAWFEWKFRRLQARPPSVRRSQPRTDFQPAPTSQVKTLLYTPGHTGHGWARHKIFDNRRGEAYEHELRDFLSAPDKDAQISELLDFCYPGFGQTGLLLEYYLNGFGGAGDDHQRARKACVNVMLNQVLHPYEPEFWPAVKQELLK